MKTLYKTIRTGTEANEKHRQLEERFGMKLTRYSTGDGWNFRPYIHEGIKLSVFHRDAMLKVLPVNGTGKSFTSIADETGISLMDVMMNIKALLVDGVAVPDVSRDGKIVGAHLKAKNVPAPRPALVAQWGDASCENCCSMKHTIFKDNGQCSCGINKHHYHCGICGKVCQVG